MRAAPFAGHPTLATGLRHAWLFDEASGQRNDEHGANHLASMNGVGSAVGKRGNAARFVAASSQFLTTPDAVLDWAATDWSVSVWVKPTFLSGFPGILTGGSSKHRVFQMGAGSLRAEWNGANSLTLLSGFTDGAWHQVITTHDNAGNQGRLYVDGVEVSAGISTFISPGGAAGMWVGSIASGGAPFNGDIEELLIADRIWTPQERTDLWAGGAGLFYADPEIARFRFDREGRPGLSRLTNVTLMTGQGD
jgi:hypothetical protein